MSSSGTQEPDTTCKGTPVNTPSNDGERDAPPQQETTGSNGSLANTSDDPALDPNIRRYTVQQAAADILRRSQQTKGRLLVALMGVPGAGKTHIGEQLALEVNRLAAAADCSSSIGSSSSAGNANATVGSVPEQHGDAQSTHDTHETKSSTVQKSEETDLKTCVCIGMDGYHLYRATLRQCPNASRALRRRGAHFTFDPRRLFADLSALRDAKDTVRLPSFDHAAKDPVQEDIEIPGSARVVIVEGLYVLLEVPPWQKLLAKLQWDMRLTVDCPLWLCGRRVTARHVEAGIAPCLSSAWRRWYGNDERNARFIMRHLNQKLLDGAIVNDQYGRPDPKDKQGGGTDSCESKGRGGVVEPVHSEVSSVNDKKKLDNNGPHTHQSDQNDQHSGSEDRDENSDKCNLDGTSEVDAQDYSDMSDTDTFYYDVYEEVTQLQDGKLD